MTSPWMILAPLAEGNHSYMYLVVERVEYVAYLTGRSASFSSRSFMFKPDAEANCLHRNRQRF